jgi:integrase
MRFDPLDASLTLADAAPKWLDQHQHYIRPNTIRNYIGAIKKLTESMGGTVLKDVAISQIRAYQVERVKTAGPYLINCELSVLQMILKESGQWKHIAEFYKPMRVPRRKAGHSLTQEEEQRLRDVAFSQPKWRLAANCMIVMLSTTMGFGELRHVRRRDVDLKKRSVLVRDGAKNFHRDRTIPMNTAAYESMCWIIDRWQDLGGSSDSEFILPHRPRVRKGPWIFTEPMLAITTAFNRIRKESGLPQFRVYDCRVQAITKLLSNPAVSPQVSREIAGHVSQVMQSHYSIQQFDTKKAAVDALDSLGASSELPSQPSPVAAQISPPVSQARDHADLALQAEIDRRVDDRVAKALEEYFASHPQAETSRRRRGTRKGADHGSSEDTVVYRQLRAGNVVAFPNRPA